MSTWRQDYYVGAEGVILIYIMNELVLFTRYRMFMYMLIWLPKVNWHRRYPPSQ